MSTADQGAAVDSHMVFDIPGDSSRKEAGPIDINLPHGSPPDDARIDAGRCLKWSCTPGIDGDEHFCLSTCDSWLLVCNASDLDCACNTKGCEPAVSMGTPCSFCQSAWNGGACCFP